MLNLIIISLIVVLSSFVVYWRLNRSIKESQAKTFIRLEKTEKWLFEQLYAIKPGAVLLPDQQEEENTHKPAVVINVGDDGMDEFDGQRDDWH